MIDPAYTYAEQEELPDQFTIYTAVNEEKKLIHSPNKVYWNLRAIELGLRKVGVVPGETPYDYPMVNGSRYFTMDYQPMEQEENTDISTVTKMLYSKKRNPYAMFATPHAPLRIDYETVEQVNEVITSPAYRAFTQGKS